MCLCVFLRACCPFLMCFTVSYESMLAYTIKAHPGAFKARTPLNAARVIYNRYFFPLFCRKTQRAAQTVRPRNLRLSQLVDLNLRRTYQSLSQIGP